VYPTTTFVTTSFHGTPVSQSRSEKLCCYIIEAVNEVCKQLHKNRVRHIGIVIYTKEDIQVQERYLLNVDGVTVMESKLSKEVSLEERDPLSPSVFDGPEGSYDSASSALRTTRPGRLDEHTPVDLSEQFHATFTLLKAQCKALPPLETPCSFHISIEPKAGEEVQPSPCGLVPDPWIFVQPCRSEAEQSSSCTGGIPNARRVKRIPIHTVQYPHLDLEVVSFYDS
jgi:mitotic spindle assembly checkpoint protein MAD2B